MEGGFVNLSIDVARVERAQGAPIPRRRLREAQAEGGRTVIDGESVVLYRARIAPRPPARTPTPRARVGVNAPGFVQLEQWAAQRRAALQAHLDAQRKALEQRDALPVPPGGQRPGMAPDSDDAKRREAALKGVEDERKRLEALLERQRKRREQELKQAEAPGQGKKDDGGTKGPGPDPK